MEFKNVSIGNWSYGNNKNMNIEDFPKVTNVDFKDENFFNHFDNKHSDNFHYIKLIFIIFKKLI